MSNELRKQYSHDPDAPNADEAKVAQMLGSMRRVEAPNDFDFRLKAKIATGRPVEKAPSRFIPALKYLAPLTLVLLIGSFVMFSGVLSSGVERNISIVPNTAPVAAESPLIVSPQPERIGAEPEPPVVETPDRIRRNEVASASPARKVGQPRTSRQPRTSGSYQIGLAVTKRVIDDPNKNANSNTSAPVKPVEVGTMDASQVFKMLEVEAEKVSNGWRVKSASAKGIGGRSGLEAGDVIEAIDGRPLDGMTVIKGKTISVIRHGKRINLDLKN